MAVLLSDDFTGANGSVLDASKWAWRSNAGELPAVISNNAAYWDNGASAACGAMVAAVTPADGEVYAELTLTNGVIGASNDQMFSISTRVDPTDTTTGLRGQANSGTVVYFDTYTRILNLRRYVGGSSFQLATYTLPTPAHTTGTTIRFRVRFEGRRYQVRVWRNAETEPTTWQIDYTGDTTTMPRLDGQVLIGARCRTNYEMSVDNVSISGIATEPPVTEPGTPGSTPHGRVKVWVGDRWVTVKYWTNASAWAPAVGSVKQWDGTTWVKRA